MINFDELNVHGCRFEDFSSIFNLAILDVAEIQRKVSQVQDDI
jgi:hypothetical protein